MIQTFGQDPLLCPRCGEEMELWGIWHPRYGDIFDWGRDSPGMGLFDEQDSGKEKAREFLEDSRWANQLLLFPGNTPEDIPADVVNFFEVIDSGDPSVPPRFRWEKCGGVMSAV